MNTNQIRERAREWAAENTDVTLMLDEDGMQKDFPDAVQISINDPDNEYGWTGFLYSTDGVVFMTETSDDIDEDDRMWLEDMADQLIAFLKGTK